MCARKLYICLLCFPTCAVGLSCIGPLWSFFWRKMLWQRKLEMVEQRDEQMTEKGWSNLANNQFSSVDRDWLLRQKPCNFFYVPSYLCLFIVRFALARKGMFKSGGFIYQSRRKTLLLLSLVHIIINHRANVLSTINTNVKMMMQQSATQLLNESYLLLV